MENQFVEQLEVDDLGDAVLTDAVCGLEKVGEVVDNVVGRTIVVTSWGTRWLGRAWKLWRNGGPAGLYATQILTKLDEVEQDPEEFLEQHVICETKMVIQTIKDKKTKEFVEDVAKIQERKRVSHKLKKGQRSNFAAAVAKKAYNKFGERPYSEANVLVTRRWLQKFFEEERFKDLRTTDKNNAIDRALFLSFVPTRDFQKARIAMATRQWQQRMDSRSAFSGFWTTVFGVGVVEPGTDDLC